MLTHEEFRKKALSNPEVQVEYEKLKPEFMLFDELLRARKKAKKKRECKKICVNCL